MDQITEICEIVRDAIEADLIPNETVAHFDDAVRFLKGNALEDYIQNLWDNV